MDTIELFKAFAEPVRLRILHLLARRGPELCVCDLVSALGLPQGTVSRHLGYLRMAGLVEDRREGVWIHYRLEEPKSAVHGALVQCLGSCLSGEAELAADLGRFDELYRARSLACCAEPCCERESAMVSDTGTGCGCA